MREIDKIAEALFDKIRSRFEPIHLKDEKSEDTTIPQNARFFNFDYTTKDGENFGNVTISLIDNDSLKVYYGQNITQGLNELQQDEWFNFLRTLRDFSRRNLLNFDTRDITRRNLDFKSIKQQSKADDPMTAKDLEITESVISESMYGSRTHSYEDRGPVKIRIKHSNFIDPEKRGSRARAIESIFLETHRGERFLLDYKNLHYARAMARHISEGGEIHDEQGQHITELMKEMASMRHFVNGARRRQFEDLETQDMVFSALRHYDQDKRLLKQMRGARGYRSYFESWVPEAPVEDTINVDALRERFVKKIYDDRFNEALPYVYRAYKKEQEALETEMAEEFAAWAESIHETSMNGIPDTVDEIQELQELMASTFGVGLDGMDAQASFGRIIGDQSINDQFEQLAQQQGPDADARPIVIKWLQQNNPELAAQFITAMQTPKTPEQPPVPNQTHGASTMDEPVVTESSLEMIKLLAGLTKK